MPGAGGLADNLVRNIGFGIDFGINDTNLRNANQQVDKLKSNVQSTGEVLYKFRRQSLVGTTALVSGIGYAVKQYADWESELIDVGVISGTTEDQLKALEQQTINLGIETHATATEVGQAQRYLAQAGQEVEEVLTNVPAVLALNAISGMEMARAADMASDVVTGFGYSAQDTIRVIDVMAKTSTKANTDVTMLGESMAMSAGSARQLGFDIEETSAVIGLMADSGIKGSKAGIYLSTGLAMLVDPSAEARKTMKDLGVQLEDEYGNMHSLAEIVGQFEVGLEGMSKATKLAALSQVFGIRSARGWMQVIGAGRDELTKFEEELLSAGGFATEWAEKKLDSLSGAWKRLKGSVNVASIIIGEKFAPAIRLGSELITGVINVFNRLPEPVQTGIAYLLGLSTAVLGIATAAGFLYKPLTSGIGLFAKYGKILLAFGGHIALIAGIIAGLYFVIEDLWVGLKGGDSTLVPLINKFLEWIGVSKDLKEIVDDTMKGIGTAFNFLKDVALGIISYYEPLFKDLFGGVLVTLKGIGQGVLGLFTTIGGLIYGLVTGDFKMFETGLEKLSEGILNIFSGIGQAIGGMVKFGIEKGYEMWSSFIDWMLTPIDFSGIFSGIGEAISSWWQNIKEGWAEIDFSGLFRNAIDKAMDNLPGWMQNMAEKIMDFLPQSPAKEGPLSKLDKVGEGFADVLGSGLMRAQNKLSGYMNSFLQPQLVTPEGIRMTPYLGEGARGGSTVINQTRNFSRQSTANPVINKYSITIPVEGAANPEDTAIAVRNVLDDYFAQANASLGGDE